MITFFGRGASDTVKGYVEEAYAEDTAEWALAGVRLQDARTTAASTALELRTLKESLKAEELSARPESWVTLENRLATLEEHLAKLGPENGAFLGDHTSDLVLPDFGQRWEAPPTRWTRRPPSTRCAGAASGSPRPGPPHAGGGSPAVASF